MEEEEEKDLELRSEEVKEIMGTPPGWIVRWGSSVALLVVALLFILAWAIPYNDVREARVELTTAVPPVEVVAKVDGLIEELYPKAKEEVRKGVLLVVMNSTAKFEDVIMLQEALADLQEANEQTILEYEPETYHIGNLQPAYSKLVTYFESYNRDKTTNFVQQEIAVVQRKKIQLRSSIEIDKSALQSLYAEYNNAVKNRERVQKMYLDGVKSALDSENATNAIKLVEGKMKAMESKIAIQEKDLIGYDQEVLGLRQNKQEEVEFNYIRFKQEIDNLQSEIETWIDQYLIKAPIDGKISFPEEVSVNQNVSRGERILNILPNEGGDWIVSGQLPLAGSGKVEEGQRVVIKFDGYPYQEYGVVEGQVLQKARMPNGNNYLLKVSLPNDLNTSYRDTLDFNQGMTGTAEIIVDERNILEVLLDKLVSKVKNN